MFGGSGPTHSAGGGTRGLALALLGLAAASAAADELTTLDPQARYPEGPLWHDGQLLYVEYAPSNVRSWDGRHTAIYWHAEGCGPSALIPFKGHLLVACYDANSLVELDASGKE